MAKKKVEETVEETPTGTWETIKTFVVTYKYWFIGGVALLVVLSVLN